jgi:hypothetical protein
MTLDGHLLQHLSRSGFSKGLQPYWAPSLSGPLLKT